MPASGHIDVSLSTIGSDVPVVLSVFTNRNDLTLIACNAGGQSDGLNAQLLFSAVSGVDYLVMVGRLGDGAGKVRLTYRGAEEISAFIVPVRLEDNILDIQLFVPPGKYIWSRAEELAIWTPMFQTNVLSGLFHYREPIRSTGRSYFFRLLPSP